MNLKTKWLIYSVAGLILVGAGMSVFGEALSRKQNSEPWFWIGTLSLVLLNSGLSFIGQAVIFKVRRERDSGNQSSSK